MIRFLGVVTLLLAAFPLPAQQLGLSIKACDFPGSATWIQTDCNKDDTRIVAWPLFSFDANKDPHEVPLQMCLAALKSCGLNAEPYFWWLGPVRSHDPALMPGRLGILEQIWEIPRPPAPIVRTAVQEMLLQLQERARLVELAWRFGDPAPQRPLFSLPQTKSAPQKDRLVPASSLPTARVGACGSLPLGTVKIAGAPWKLVSDCSPPSSSANPDDALRSLVSGKNFTWRIEGDAPGLDRELVAGTPVDFDLFPYEMAETTTLSGNRGYARAALPRPAAAGFYLMSLQVQIHIPPPGIVGGGRGGGTPASDFTIFVVVIVLAITVIGFGAYQSNRRLAPAGDRFSPQAGETGPRSFSQKLAARFGIGTRNDPAQWQNQGGTPSSPQEPRPKQGPPPDAGEAAAVSNDNTLRQTIDAVDRFSARTQPDPALEKNAQEIKALNEELKTLRTAQQNLKTQLEELNSKKKGSHTDEAKPQKNKADEQKIAQLEAKVTKLSESVTGLEADLKREASSATKIAHGLTAEVTEKLSDFQARLVQHETALPNLMAGRWSDWRKEFFELESKPAAATDSANLETPPKLEPKAASILQLLFEFSTFGLDLLRSWLGNCDSPGKSRKSDPLGVEALEDLRALEAVAHNDRLLWAWWLGRLPTKPSGTVRSAINQAKKKWLMTGVCEPVTYEEMAQLALRWADERLPHIQTLIEATALGWGTEADPMQLREALKAAAEPLCGAPQDLATSISALSNYFHNQTAELFKSANAQYVKIRLYQDRMETGDIAAFIAATQSASDFTESDALIQSGVADSHGMVVRILQPISKRRDRGTGQNQWEGRLYYLKALKK